MLILLQERRVWRTAKMKQNCTPLCAAPWSTLWRALRRQFWRVAGKESDFPGASENSLDYGEQKTDKEKSHKGIWWWECPGSVPGINSGRPRHTRDVWSDLCENSHSRGRMSAGQTGKMTEQMGHVHGTDGIQTRGCPAKILYVYSF